MVIPTASVNDGLSIGAASRALRFGRKSNDADAREFVFPIAHSILRSLAIYVLI